MKISLAATVESGMLVTCCIQHAMSVSTLLQCGDSVSPGGKPVSATVMCPALHVYFDPL